MFLKPETWLVLCTRRGSYEGALGMIYAGLCREYIGMIWGLCRHCNDHIGVIEITYGAYRGYIGFESLGPSMLPGYSVRT